MGTLTDPVVVAGVRVPSRVVFGPHETNLAAGRSIGHRHVAYYAARAAGGAGVVVTETASVHPSDWPYERAPLASACGPGWRAVVDALRPHGTVVLAGLGHAGGQGSSDYSQSVLWAPSRVADAITREMPLEMGSAEIDSLVDGFASSARLAVASGLDGVEVDAGQYSLLRQFHSGLTNRREDGYGEDRLRMTREVLDAVRAAVGPGHLVGLRLSCDELAPWAGVTPELAAAQVDALADRIDLLVVVRGGPYSTSAYRPDAHTPAATNLELCRAMRDAAGSRVPVVLQGSVVDPDAAETALAAGIADLVEMTRAQIAEPRLVELVRAGTAERARPCILCNQACQVRDNRNPLVSCVGEPRSGHETVDPDPLAAPAPAQPDEALVVGAGVAGLECARVLSARGWRVRVLERTDRAGGVLRAAAIGPGRRRLADLAGWLESECRRQGVVIETGREATAPDLDGPLTRGTAVILATGGRPAPQGFHSDGSRPVVDAATALAGLPADLPDGPVVVHDPVGGPIAVGVAEWLAEAGRTVSLVTPDQIAGTLLARSGDLADANTRLQRAGVHRELRARLREVRDGSAWLEDVWTGAVRTVACAVVIDCAHRLAEESLYLERPGTPRAGDCVAPRGMLEAVLEGRRRALEACGVCGAPLTAVAGGVAS